MIIWINGAFGAGKTALAEELHRRLPDAVLYNPEDVGLMLWKQMRPDGDFQHLPRTLMLRSDKLTPAELADEVLARSQR